MPNPQTNLLSKQKKDMAEQTITPAEVRNDHDDWNELFTSDVIQHKKGRIEGGLGQWEYSSPRYPNDPVNGSENWVRFLENHPEYYLMEAEIELAKLAAPIIPNLIQDPAILVMLGVGNKYALKRKDIQATSKVPNVEGVNILDISSSYIGEGLPVIEKAHPGVTASATITDIFNGFHVNRGYHPDSRVIATMFGCTLDNVPAAREDFTRKLIPPEDAIRRRLAAVRQSLRKGDLFITTHDGNQDSEKVEAAYRGQTQFATNLAHRIKRDTPYKKTDTERVSFRVEFNKQSSSLYHYLTLDFGEGHGPQEIMINNSPKIDPDTRAAWYDEEKFEPLKTIEHDGVYLNILEAV